MLVLISQESLALKIKKKVGKIAKSRGFEEVMPERLSPENLALVNMDSRRWRFPVQKLLKVWIYLEFIIESNN